MPDDDSERLNGLIEAARGNEDWKDYLEPKLFSGPFKQRNNPLPQIESPNHDRDDDGVSSPSAHEVSPMNERFFKWIAGVSATIVSAVFTAGIIWIVSISASTASKVDLLLARPVSVPMEQYNEDRKETMDKLKAIEDEMSALKGQVKALRAQKE